MRIWIELHCDGGIDISSECVNHHHNYPSFLTSTFQCKTKLLSEAKSLGWKIKGNNCYCPACKDKF